VSLILSLASLVQVSFPLTRFPLVSSPVSRHKAPVFIFNLPPTSTILPQHLSIQDQDPFLLESGSRPTDRVSEFPSS